MDDETNYLLVVEDSPEDFELMDRSFKRSNLRNPVVHVESGESAMHHLSQSRSEKTPLPCLVLLDLNLPGIAGFEVLKKIRENPLTRKLPVIVLSSSSDDFDIDQCYNLGANSYIMKPVTFDGFIQAMRYLKEYWFELSVIPKPYRV